MSIYDELENAFGNIEENISAVINQYSKRIRRVNTKVEIGYFSTNSGLIQNDTFNVSNTIKNEVIKKLIIKQEAPSIPIGCAISSTCEFSFINNINSTGISNPQNLLNYYIKVYSGVQFVDEETRPSICDVNGYAWVPVGVFKIKEITTEDNWKTVNISAFDSIAELDNNMNFGTFPELTQPAYLGTYYGTTLRITDQYLFYTEISVEDSKVLKGMTFREALGYIAGREGRAAQIVNGELYFVYPQNDERIYNEDGKQFKISYKPNERVKLSDIYVGNSNEKYRSPFIHNASKFVINTPFDAAYVYDSNIDDIVSNFSEAEYDGGDTGGAYTFYSDGEYEAGSLECLGTPFWSIGQIITFLDQYGVLRRIWICSIEMNLSSGLSIKIESKTPDTELLQIPERNVTMNEINEAIETKIETKIETATANLETKRKITVPNTIPDDLMTISSTIDGNTTHNAVTDDDTLSYGICNGDYRIGIEPLVHPFKAGQKYRLNFHFWNPTLNDTTALPPFYGGIGTWATIDINGNSQEVPCLISKSKEFGYWYSIIFTSLGTMDERIIITGRTMTDWDDFYFGANLQEYYGTANDNAQFEGTLSSYTHKWYRVKGELKGEPPSVSSSNFQPDNTLRTPRIILKGELGEITLTAEKLQALLNLL